MTMTAILYTIEAERERQGLTKKELCARAGLSNAVFSNWMRGRCCPTVSTLIDICNALGLTVWIGRPR